MPARYTDGATHASPSNTHPAASDITGSFAPHGTNDAVMTAFSRSLRSSIIRADMIPGTEQPLPTIMGIQHLPDSPTAANNLSVITTARLMYPDSSRSDSMK